MLALFDEHRRRRFASRCTQTRLRQLRIEPLEARKLLYAQGGPDANDNFVDTPVHQWITAQGYNWYADQFGISQAGAFLGAVGLYPNGANNRIVEGAFDEDVPFENPWDEGGGFQDLDHPSTRHFWAHDANYARAFDDGIASYDSAANRALKYFTGGFGLTNVFDADWGSSTRLGNVATQGQGIDELHSQNVGQAYYWLGHVAHLLQDLTLPSHAHADAHADRGFFADPDPLHDWVDGAVFSTAGANSRPQAAFNDATPRRWELWQFQPSIGSKGLGGAGRVGAPLSDAGLIRSRDEVLQSVQARLASEPELAASIPSGARADVLPLYALLLEAAALADNYDTKDAVGQVDRGARRGSTSSSGSGYDQFTRDELNQMADVLVPRAMRATAELLRYFYAAVETATGAGGPSVALVGLGQQPESSPLEFSSSRMRLTAAATDQDTGDSGVGRALFHFEYRERAPGGVFGPWRPVIAGVTSDVFADGTGISPQFAGKHGAAVATQFQGLPGYTYGFRVSAEDGAGHRTFSSESYVRVSPLAAGPLPDTAGLYSPTGGTFFLRYANEAGAADSVFGYGPVNSSLRPVAGDWDASAAPGGDTVGVFEPARSVFFLRNANSAGIADAAFTFGPANSGWTPVSGDWNGDGVDSVGLFNATTSTFYLRNGQSAGVADAVLGFGPAGANWLPIAGDWDGDGFATVGLFNPVTSTFFLRNSLSAGAADAIIAYGPPGAGWLPVAGDWDGDGDDTLGLFNPASSRFFLRNSLSPGAAEIAFSYGPAGAGWLPIFGQWQRGATFSAGTVAAAVEVNALAAPGSPPVEGTPSSSVAAVAAAPEKTEPQIVDDARQPRTSFSDRLIARRTHAARRALELVFDEWS